MAATVLVAGTMALAGSASPAQAVDTCAGLGEPPSGTMCVHIYKETDGKTYWFGPWAKCVIHNIPSDDDVTWVRSNQKGIAWTSYYTDFNGVGYLDSTPAVYYGRPPGYITKSWSLTRSIKVC